MKITGLRVTLRPFQDQGVRFLEKRKGRVLLADEMGLGKTIQSIAWLQLHPEVRPALVICPASLKLNWRDEIRKCVPRKQETIEVIQGRDALDLEGSIIIINYDLLEAWEYFLVRYKPQVVIVDECHAIKNSKAKRTQTVKTLARKAPHVICLSGTPIINRPVELFNTINLIDPKIFPSVFRYGMRYCGLDFKHGRFDYKGATHTDELHKILSGTIMLRRLKSEVLKELPPKERIVIPLEMNNSKKYARISRDFGKWAKENVHSMGKEKTGAEALVRIGKLKRLAVKGKMTQAIQWIRDFLDMDDQKLVVFAIHHWVIDLLLESFQDIPLVKLDGRDSMVDRNDAVKEFQHNPKIRLFVGQIKAAGTGLTLTASSTTCHLELGWTPGEHDQAEDRVHRIGQKAESIKAYYLIAGDSIEKDIALLQDQKREVLSQVLDGKEVQTKSILTELMKRVAGVN